MGSGLAITHQIPPMLGSLPSRGIGCSPCDLSARFDFMLLRASLISWLLPSIVCGTDAGLAGASG
jgi:hypothetical protein